jgi:hypothetical protein
MNMSFEGVAGISTISSAAQYARNKGCVVVAAAGNTGALDSTPENPNMISVSATDQANNLASWSSQGAFVDVAAPGVDIYTTVNGGGYGSTAGTSFSSPITAGVVALIMAANPRLTAAEVERVLTSTADDLGAAGRDTSYGFGLINAQKAVLAASSVPPPSTDTTPPTVTISAPIAGTMVSGTITVSVSAADNVGVTKVELYLDGSLFAQDSLAPYTFTWDTTKTTAGNYTLTAVAYDAAGNRTTSAPVSVIVSNLAADITPPTVAITAPSSNSVVAKLVKVTVQALDNNLVSSVALLVDGKVSQTITCNASSVNLTFSLNTRKIGSGNHTLTAAAQDATGNKGVSSPVTVTVK